MKKAYIAGALLVITGLAIIAILGASLSERSRAGRLHFERAETEFVVSSQSNQPASLFKAGKNLQDAIAVAGFDGRRIWLPPGNYFLRLEQPGGTLFYPVPVFGYQSGPDAEGRFALTVRNLPADVPPRLLSDSPEFVYIPSGHFLLGDRLNPHEPHHVWLTGFFIARFEVTNAEFKEFLSDPHGYADGSNWTEDGRLWKDKNSSKATALLAPSDSEFKRFGQPDQPVVQVTWHEANAFSRWLNRRIGGPRWLFGLPTEAEWEKAARGPDSFDYGLSRSISDTEVPLYNWQKNPDAAVTVMGIRDSLIKYTPNRYGLYHMSGNVVEWTQSIFEPYSRERPYVDEKRNRDQARGQRVARGGSWYSASVALLYIPYRDAFQPEVRNHDLGFRIVARPLPYQSGAVSVSRTGALTGSKLARSESAPLTTKTRRDKEIRRLIWSMID
jgi:formylglycine-generating enzyme required for sulfatase activity